MYVYMYSMYLSTSCLPVLSIHIFLFRSVYTYICFYISFITYTFASLLFFYHPFASSVTSYLSKGSLSIHLLIPLPSTLVLIRSESLNELQLPRFALQIRRLHDVPPEATHLSPHPPTHTRPPQLIACLLLFLSLPLLPLLHQLPLLLFLLRLLPVLFLLLFLLRLSPDSLTHSPAA